MKTLLRSFVLLAALAGATPAVADPLPPPRIGVVDLEQLSRDSAVTKDLDAKIEAEKQRKKASLQTKFARLQEELRALRLESASLSTEEATRRREDLQRRIEEAATEQETAMASIDARGQKAMQAMQDDLYQIVAKVAEGMTLDMVLAKTAYDSLVADNLAAPGAEDITGVVMVFLNDRFPTAQLPPAEGGSTP
jgi:Skp family chaperone for outer membrane proteins